MVKVVDWVRDGGEDMDIMGRVVVMVGRWIIVDGYVMIIVGVVVVGVGVEVWVVVWVEEEGRKWRRESEGIDRGNKDR